MANYGAATGGATTPPRTPRGLAELDDLERVFGALAHASRRHVLVVLRARGGAMSAGDIARRFSCSWPTTTRHLKVLVDAGLVRVTRQGRERRYELDLARLRGVAGRWLSWFDDERGASP